MKQNRKSPPFSSSEEEFESLMYMQYDIAQEKGGTYVAFGSSGEASEILKSGEMKGIIMLFENGLNCGSKVLTEKNPETRFERTRKYLELNGIRYWIMRRQRKNPKNWNLIPGTESYGFCLFDVSEEQGHDVARRFGMESLIVFILDPDLKVFLVGTQGSRFQGMHRTLYRFEEPEAMIPLQHVIYESKLYRELLKCKRLIKEVKVLESIIRKRRRAR